MAEEDKNLDPGKANKVSDDTPPKDKEDEPGKALPPEDKDEPKDLSDDDIDELIKEDERQWLKSQGLDFKSMEDFVKSHKHLRSEGTKAFNQIKSIADTIGRTPEEVLDHLNSQVAGMKRKASPSKGDDKPSGVDEGITKEINDLKGMMGQQAYDYHFLMFQREMDKEGIDIPAKLQAKITPIAKRLIRERVEDEGTTLDQLAEEGYNPFFDAYDHHLWKLKKEGKLEELEKTVDLMRNRRDKKRRQLGIPAGSASKEKGPASLSEEEHAVIWGTP